MDIRLPARGCEDDLGRVICRDQLTALWRGRMADGRAAWFLQLDHRPPGGEHIACARLRMASDLSRRAGEGLCAPVLA